MVVKLEPEAHRALREIFNYHLKVAGRRTARKIVQQIKGTFLHLSLFPMSGQVIPDMETLPSVFRSLVAHKNYKVIYYIKEDILYIATIWDTRQHPGKLRDILR